MAKGLKRGVEKRQNPRPVFFYFYWLSDARRGRIRDARKQSLDEDPKIENRGRICPLGLFLLLLAKGRKRGAEKGGNSPLVFFYFYWLKGAKGGWKRGGIHVRSFPTSIG